MTGNPYIVDCDALVKVNVDQALRPNPRFNSVRITLRLFQMRITSPSARETIS
jgi:hypothetical protein